MRDFKRERENTLVRHLNSLGGSADSIAKELERMNIKGKVDNYSQCPIAMYLKRKRYKYVSVDSTIRCCNRSCNYIKIELPKQIVTFVNNFDNEEYPKLVRK